MCYRPRFLLCLCLPVLAVAAPAIRGEGVSLNNPPLPPLDLRLVRDDSPLERTPAYVVSPVFRAYVEPNRSTLEPLRTANLEELANEQMARAIEQNAFAASANSGACINRRLGDSPGAGVRWSSSSGFGLYYQGKSLRALQRLLRLNDVCGGDSASPVCKTLPSKVCD